MTPATRTRIVRINGADRSPGDCLRVAVAVAYGVPYNETPNPEIGGDSAAFWDAWFSWHPPGFEWWKSSEFAPTAYPAWVAGVDQPGQDPDAPRLSYHAVPMSRDRLLVDPARWQGSGTHYYREVRPSDVRHALMLVPAGTGELPRDGLSPIKDKRLAPWVSLTVQRRVRLYPNPRMEPRT